MPSCIAFPWPIPAAATRCVTRSSIAMVQTADDATTVAAVGRRCGFNNAGHFARYYREMVGELPSVTLALANRTRRTKSQLKG
jgi:AraC-like DNA-binding protein